MTQDVASTVILSYIFQVKDLKPKWTLVPIYNSWYAKYMNYDAVVIYPFVLFKNDISGIKPSYVKHEMIHVKQLEEVGYNTFFEDYAKEMEKHGYLENKYEVEAFSNEHFPLTEEELNRLSLPIDFPKTDKEQQKKLNKNSTKTQQKLNKNSTKTQQKQKNKKLNKKERKV